MPTYWTGSLSRDRRTAIYPVRVKERRSHNLTANQIVLKLIDYEYKTAEKKFAQRKLSRLVPDLAKEGPGATTPILTFYRFGGHELVGYPPFPQPLISRKELLWTSNKTLSFFPNNIVD